MIVPTLSNFEKSDAKKSSARSTGIHCVIASFFPEFMYVYFIVFINMSI